MTRITQILKNEVDKPSLGLLHSDNPIVAPTFVLDDERRRMIENEIEWNLSTK